MNNLHIENSYKIWNKHTMNGTIVATAEEQYNTPLASALLNRTYKSMRIEWYLHNIGYYLTLPFIFIPFIEKLNIRFKHVDLEEHIRPY